MTIQIPLTLGKVALIDDADEDVVRRHTWHARCNAADRTCYALTNVKDANRHRTISMHRLLLTPPSDMQVDHIDGDGLNNLRSNLRIVTRAQNQQNRRKPINGLSSRFKGVSWRSHSNRWVASITANGKCIRIGLFDSEEDAARAYDEVASEMFGEYARLNFSA